MKLLGLIGGVSWESSIEYYRLMNEAVKKRMGGLHSARCLMYSVDFAPVEAAMVQGDWEKIRREMQKIGQILAAGGAEGIVICSNTMHMLAPDIEAVAGVPVLHIADGPGALVKENGVGKVALLGTKYAMEGSFYRDRLTEKFGLTVLIPDEQDRVTINDIIFQELCRGVIRPESKKIYQDIIGKLVKRGAEGVILGCTEIPLLIGPGDAAVPVYDTMRIHVETAVEWAFS